MNRRTFITTAIGLTLLAPTLTQAQNQRYTKEEFEKLMLEFVELYRDSNDSRKTEILHTWDKLTTDFEKHGQVAASNYCRGVSNALVECYGGVR